MRNGPDKLNEPPSDAELEELGDFLGHDEHDRLPLVACEGLFAALHCSPEMIMPSEWFPLVVGDDAGLGFDAGNRARHISGLIVRTYNSVGAQLRDDSKVFEPSIGDESGELSPGAAVLWAAGFMEGVALRDRAWQPFIDSQAGAAIVPIFELSRFLYPKSRRKLDSKRTRRFAEDLGWCATRIYDYWLEQRLRAEQPVRRRTPKVGRNEPCPCRSGQKYKRCCANDVVSQQHNARWSAASVARVPR